MEKLPLTAMLKRLFAGIIALVTFAFAMPALADGASGAQVFSANCAACHIGGGNAVNAAKTLKMADLEQYGMNSTEAIVTQVTNGKNAMPSFKGRITDDEIAAVAAYVLQQSEAGW
jgi:cytochrome c6